MIFIFLLLTAHQALAGGVVVRRESISFVNGSRVVAPGAEVSMSFEVNEYIYGEKDYGYVAWAVVSAKSSDHPSKSELASWKIYGALSKAPGRVVNTEDIAGIYRFRFNAPDMPGKYKIFLGGIPLFRNSPFTLGTTYRESFIPTPLERDELAKALVAYRGAVVPVTEFTVSSSPQAAAQAPRVYLRLNGQPPSNIKTEGGFQKNPMNFSWFGGPAAKYDRRKVEYRHRLQPDDDERWSPWSTRQQLSYSFLLKGYHALQVQARYADAPEAVSEQAVFQFSLSKDFFSQPTKETLLKVPFGTQSDLRDVSFESVYAKSRALLVGVWNFQDHNNFPLFGEAQISADLAAMDKALKQNGFTVSQLSGNQVSRDNILDALNELVNSSGRNDRLFVYFSTHGFPDPENPSESYLATSDCEMKNPGKRCMRLKELQSHADRALQGRQVKQVLFAVDSCFSGLGVITKSPVITDLSRLADPQGSFMLTAGMANQLAQIDSTLGKSTFTHYLAEGLTGKADILSNGGMITLSELFVYVQYNVAKTTGAKQIPMLGRMQGDGEMIFKPAKNE